MGHPVPIVVPSDEDDDHSFHLDRDALEKVLSANDIKDRFIVIVSIAGAFRKGKSFLLDFLLRYLDSKGNENWLGNEDQPLKGFPWRGGSERDTTGILIWSELFPVTLPSGEDVVVLLMDTQGAFDTQSTVKDCATVFALSTMISSVQVYNLSQNIQEDDLQHLQLFTEYGRLAMEESPFKPFQKLQFLVRDWSFPYDSPYGFDGGSQLLEKRLLTSDKQHAELQTLRNHIRSCFDVIECFLMPHPGLKVSTKQEFDGRLSDIEPDFVDNLKILVPMLLAPENLVIKEISGQKVRAKELLTYFQAYMDIYKGSELPEPKSMLEATAEANNLSASAAARELYTQKMEGVCGGGQPYLSSDRLSDEHFAARDAAAQMFNSRRKMGGEHFSEKYHIALLKEIDDLYVQYQCHNESKNVFKAARTPSVLLSLSMVLYIMSGLFSLVGLSPLSGCCNAVMMLLIAAVVVWAYCRYSGEFVNVAQHIDDITEEAWQHFVKPMCQLVMTKSSDMVVQRALNSQPPRSTLSSAAKSKRS